MIEKNQLLIKECHSPEETYRFAKELAAEAKPGEIYCLSGDLGVGKTVFTKGFAAGLGITEPVNSPTFTIMQIYEEGRLPLYHFDVYRITDPEEMDEIGYEDYFFGDGVCLIEWAELIEELLPADCKKIVIAKDLEQGFDFRRIELTVSE
ncbi:MAG: tRNA (adenosine(37)-N6)-threonylcarbamoyltransferase complex ATPase subunit type 1 TsaE [Lachnospiraceae bacterium]